MIKYNAVKYKTGLNHLIKDLLTQLLNKDREKRPEIKEIMKHPLMLKIMKHIEIKQKFNMSRTNQTKKLKIKENFEKKNIS